MRTPDRRSYDSPRRGGRDDFGSKRGGGRDDFQFPNERDPFAPIPTTRGNDRADPYASRGPVAFGPETTATVKWFNTEKGFGFVELAEGGDAFLHASVLTRAGHQTVSPGAILRVRTGQGQKGPQVAEVLSVEEGTVPAPAARSPYGGPGGGMGSGMGGGMGGGASMERRPARVAPDPSTAVEVRGTVKWFNPEKGFGFVVPEDGGKDVFVHISAVSRGGLTTLEPNQVVKLQVADGRRGPEAISVELG